LPGLKLVLR